MVLTTLTLNIYTRTRGGFGILKCLGGWHQWHDYAHVNDAHSIIFQNRMPTGHQKTKMKAIVCTEKRKEEWALHKDDRSEKQESAKREISAIKP